MIELDGCDNRQSVLFSGHVIGHITHPLPSHEPECGVGLPFLSGLGCALCAICLPFLSPNFLPSRLPWPLFSSWFPAALPAMPLHSSPAPSATSQSRSPFHPKTNLDTTVPVDTRASSALALPKPVRPVLKESRLSDDGQGALGVDMLRSMREGSADSSLGVDTQARRLRTSLSRSRSRSKTPVPLPPLRLRSVSPIPSNIAPLFPLHQQPIIPIIQSDSDQEEVDPVLTQALEKRLRAKRNARELSVPFKAGASSDQPQVVGTAIEEMAQDGSGVLSKVPSTISAQDAPEISSEEHGMLAEHEEDKRPDPVDAAGQEQDKIPALTQPSKKAYTFENDVFGFGCVPEFS